MRPEPRLAVPPRRTRSLPSGPWDDGPALVEVHGGPKAGQVFIYCGPCNAAARVDQRENLTPPEALAAHLRARHPEEARRADRR